MIISSASLIIPSVLRSAEIPSVPEEPSRHVLALSRFTSIILLIFYVTYLCFQTWTHAHLFDEANEDEEGETNKLGLVASSIILIIATIGVAECSDSLVDSVDGVVEAVGIGRAFIGLIIVPIVGNAGEFVATVQWARTGKINLAIGVIVGSTLQISLFVTPFLVVVGWILGSPMSLQFDPFETVVLAVSVLVVDCMIRDGQANYFEGFLLVGA